MSAFAISPCGRVRCVARLENVGNVGKCAHLRTFQVYQHALELWGSNGELVRMLHDVHNTACEITCVAVSEDGSMVKRLGLYPNLFATPKHTHKVV